ncbi:MAG: YcnI family protein [Acidimicrobiales bacterium]|nr:YcnI family protein [Acidimicrobiales bacterium]
MRTRQTLAITGLAGTALLGLALPATAHVGPSPSSAPAGSFLKFELRVAHGCGETGNTTKVEVQIPEGITSVTPQVVPGWAIERTVEPVDPPADDGHGGEITERTAVVSWTGGPLLHDELEEFGLSVALPDTPGETLFFPTIQTCDDGSTADWIQLPQGDEEPDQPAPAIELTATADDEHGTAAAPVEEEEPDEVEEGTAELDPEGAAASGSDDDPAEEGLAIAALVVGALGLAAGGTALLRGRRSA